MTDVDGDILLIHSQVRVFPTKICSVGGGGGRGRAAGGRGKL